MSNVTNMQEVVEALLSAAMFSTAMKQEAGIEEAKKQALFALRVYAYIQVLEGDSFTAKQARACLEAMGEDAMAREAWETREIQSIPVTLQEK